MVRVLHNHANSADAKSRAADLRRYGHQYASTDSVDAGFCALSASVSPEGLKGCFYVVPEAPDVVQGACVAKNTKNKKGAELFAGYLLSEHALKIKQKYGYH